MQVLEILAEHRTPSTVAILERVTADLYPAQGQVAKPYRLKTVHVQRFDTREDAVAEYNKNVSKKHKIETNKGDCHA